MAKPKVFIARKIFPEWIEAILEECDGEVWEDELPPPRDVLLEKVQGLDGLLCLLTEAVNAELMDAAGPQLKVLSQIAVGFDNIDVPEATRRGIPVGNTPEVLTETTADATWALMLAAARRIVESNRAVHSGNWRTWHPLHYLGQDIYGATLGIIGLGRIGIAVARRAAGFGMRVIYNDVFRREDMETEMGVEFADMDTLLAESDYVSLHMNLTPENHHFMNDDAFEKMKSTAIVVNAARGPAIDPRALYRALTEGKIGAAALDVTDPEPIPLDDPLLTLDNCVVVPHIASASVHTRREMSRISATNLLRGVKGERLLTCVNPEVYDD